MNRLDLLRAQWDRTLAALLSAVGVIVLIVGYVRISGTPYPAEQLPLVLSAGVGALFLLGAGATLWLSADLRDEWVKLDELAAYDVQVLAHLETLAATHKAVSDGPVTGAEAAARSNGQLSPAAEPKLRRVRA